LISRLAGYCRRRGDSLYRVLLTNAIRALSGDHEGTFIVPCTP
jgi:hypothetical protein